MTSPIHCYWAFFHSFVTAGQIGVINNIAMCIVLLPGESTFPVFGLDYVKGGQEGTYYFEQGQK